MIPDHFLGCLAGCLIADLLVGPALRWLFQQRRRFPLSFDYANRQVWLQWKWPIRVPQENRGPHYVPGSVIQRWCILELRTPRQRWEQELERRLAPRYHFLLDTSRRARIRVLAARLGRPVRLPDENNAAWRTTEDERDGTIALPSYASAWYFEKSPLE